MGKVCFKESVKVEIFPRRGLVIHAKGAPGDGYQMYALMCVNYFFSYSFNMEIQVN